MLQSGDIAGAGAHGEGDDPLASALAVADPGMRALAWEMQSRVATAENDKERACICIDHVLAIVDRSEIPLAAWQVHRTAWELPHSLEIGKGRIDIAIRPGN